MDAASRGSGGRAGGRAEDRRVTGQPRRRRRLLPAALLLALCSAVLLSFAALTGAAAPDARAASNEAPRLARLSTTRAARTQLLTLTGRGFGAERGTSTVSFGESRTRTYLSWEDTRIVCRVPAQARIGAQWVRVVTPSGTSNGRLLQVRRAITLGTPKPVRPEGTVESARPQFRWRAARNATSYEVRVVLNGVTIYSQARIMGRSLRLPHALPAGAPVSWKVRARRAGRAGPWSQAAEFRVRRRPTNGGERTYGELMLFAGGFAPEGFWVADGGDRDIGYWPLSFSLLRTAFGQDEPFNFRLPLALEWPAGARPEKSSSNGRWLVAFGEDLCLWPCGVHADALPGQVMFSAGADLPWNGWFRQELADQGAVSNPAGAEVFTNCAAYDVPTDRESPDWGWLVGELRIFKETAPLPEGFIPADGRGLVISDYDDLYSVIGYTYGWVSSTQFRVPAVTAPDGYYWAIAAEGEYPVRQ